MKTIDKATVKQYWKDKRGFWWLFGSILLPLFLGAMTMWLGEQHKNDSLWGCGFLLFAFSLAVLLIVGFGYGVNDECYEREESWQYKLLDRWVEWSDQPLSMFPSSNIGSKYLELWAIKELTSRAQLLNERYSREEDFYNQEKKIDWEMLSPKRGEQTKVQRTIRESFMKSHIKNAKDSFLNLWDLVTEKDGIGILAGPEWQDPEAFRQKVLAAGCPYIRIGFNAY